MPLLQKGYLGSTPLFRERPWFYKIESSLTGRTDSTTTVTASATAHTKGSWTQLIASTSGVTTFVVLSVSVAASATDTATLIDIGTGASGSETSVVSNIAVGGTGALLFAFPINIASGSRISCRAQSSTGSRNVTINRITCFNLGEATLLPTTVDVLGTDTATSTGTAMSGSTGTWVQITASTSKDYIGFIIVPSSSDADTAGRAVILDIGVGASGSETAFGTLLCAMTSSESVNARENQINVAGRDVPAGSRIAIRHNMTSAPDDMDACVIAIPKP